tara:strand:- start:1639 stop:1845 length:207 start_codon:yes stop_codon:yes gene_type:complete
MGHYEDFWWEIDAEIKQLGLKKEFNSQLKKMLSQDKHRHKDSRAHWEYAYNKVKKIKNSEDPNQPTQE